MFWRCQYVILPSVKATWSRSIPNPIQASNCSTVKSAAIGLGHHGCVEPDAIDCDGSPVGTCSPNVKWFGGTGSSDWGRISGVEGSDGVSAYVESSEAVTPVSRNTLDGGWYLLLLLDNNDGATNTQVQFLTVWFVLDTWYLDAVDEPPHQICSYTLLFLLFLYFLYIVDPPLCTPAPTRLDRTRTRFIWPISLIWWTHVLRFTCFISILSKPNVCPPMVQPIMSPRTMQSGTYYSFASDEPYALFLVDHSYLTCMYLPFDT